MRIDRIASVPLLVQDPYFSIWSPADRLYEADTTHWSQAKQRLYGYVVIDKQVFGFLGKPGILPVISQTGLSVTATATEYIFENDSIQLKVRFTSPLLLDTPLLVSRPCTYMDYQVNRKQDVAVQVVFEMTADLVSTEAAPFIGGTHKTDSFHYASMGRAEQHPLGHSGDRITIDWGYAYLAAEDADTAINFDKDSQRLIAVSDLGTEKEETSLVVAYDDLLSIHYFGTWRKAYWTQFHPTILDAIAASFQEKKEILQKAASFDAEMEEKALAIGGPDYVLLCDVSYRQAVAAHKLITDEEGNLIFLSKENDSNGCIGTVDVSYPSIPLFLLYGTEYVKGMLLPIFRFAECPVWEYDFAPHDVGRYPYADGQVYGLNSADEGKEYDSGNGRIYPFYYQYPSGSKVYDLNYQMPVEECGNMLIMTAVVCEQDQKPDFALPYYSVLKQWTEYLLEYGLDPGEQLCTDDFAGHLSHNVNLSAKAIMGIEAFARLSKQMGKEEDFHRYHNKAAEMAASWEERALSNDHYRLAFDQEESWSLKYNLVWDRFFGSQLFTREVYERETAYYLKHKEAYGIPLDCRRSYTKSDWILWCAALAPNQEQLCELLAPVASYIRGTNTRVPFSDWYDTISGDYEQFIARSVQGGIFMPLFLL